jgi:hypothetical protein
MMATIPRPAKWMKYDAPKVANRHVGLCFYKDAAHTERLLRLVTAQQLIICIPPQDAVSTQV